MQKQLFKLASILLIALMTASGSFANSPRPLNLLCAMEEATVEIVLGSTLDVFDESETLWSEGGRYAALKSSIEDTVSRALSTHDVNISSDASDGFLVNVYGGSKVLASGTQAVAFLLEVFVYRDFPPFSDGPADRIGVHLGLTTNEDFQQVVIDATEEILTSYPKCTDRDRRNFSERVSAAGIDVGADCNSP